VVGIGGDAAKRFRRGDPPGGALDFRLPPRELAPELRHQRGGALRVDLLERVARGFGDDERHQPHGRDHRDGERDQQPGPELHGASQTESSRGSPQGAGFQPRTRAPSP
jgi:hypothetical protein